MNESKPTQLKPCPFCGGDARLNVRSYTDAEADANNAYAGCIDCGVKTPWRFAAAGAANAWNQRSGDATDA